jgi:hypothetical protein
MDDMTSVYQFVFACPHCGADLFYLKHKPLSGALVLSGDCIYADGRKPRNGTPIECSACDYSLATSDMRAGLIRERTDANRQVTA